MCLGVYADNRGDNPQTGQTSGVGGRSEQGSENLRSVPGFVTKSKPFFHSP